MADEEHGFSEGALQFVSELATAVSTLQEVDGVRIAVLPNGVDEWRTEIIDTERYRDHPRRKSGAVAVRDVDSLIEYIDRHKTEATVAFADAEGGIRCVLNHHAANMPEAPALSSRDTSLAGWSDHVVTLRRRQTRGFAAWMAWDGKYMTQQQFAEFLEDRVTEINDPPGGELLEIAQFFQAHTAISVTSARQLSNGQVQMQYVEDIKESGGANGDTKVPTDFRLVLRPYMDSTPREEGQPDTDQFVTEAKLRYRIGTGNEAGKVKFMFKLSEDLLLQLEGVHNAAIERVRRATGVPVLLEA